MVRPLILGLLLVPLVARAADQSVLGAKFLLKGGPDARRKVVVKAKEVGSSATIVGDPVANGALLTITANGGSPSHESYSLSQTFWSGDVVKGFKYKDPSGLLRALMKLRDGTFTVKALVKKSAVGTLVPPNPGTDALVELLINGGDRYTVAFASGIITNDGDKSFKVLPQKGGSSSTTSTTSTSTTTSSITTTSITTTTSTTSTTVLIGCSTRADQVCKGYATRPNQYDPCNAASCDGLVCTAGVVAPDNTPCDDSANCSFSYPSSGGCPSNKCVGGSNSGANCASDAQCPGGTCFMNRCLGGPVPDTGCATNQDCIGAGTRGNCAKVVIGLSNQTLCDSGSEAGHHCRLSCVGGVFAGFPCVADSDCFDGVSGSCPGVNSSTDCPPAGQCVRWSDAGDGTCSAIQSNPFCNTVVDCPTMRYCALDPKNLLGGAALCRSNFLGDPPPTTADDCCASGVSLGPCLMYDSCVDHVCRRTAQAGNLTVACGGSSRLVYGESGCPGGSTGAGGIVGKTCVSAADCQGAQCVSGRCESSCNNVCQAGQCTSASYANCLCESAGDRACAAGQTCCGVQGTCKRFGDSCAANVECCSNSCRNTKCDQEDITCKRFGTPCAASSECCSSSCSGGFCTAVNPGDNCFDLMTDQHHCGACDTDCGASACVGGTCQ